MWFTVSLILAVLLVSSWLWWSTRYFRVRSELMRYRREADQRARLEQEQAAEREAQQNALFNSMLEGVLILDADDRVLLVNDSLRKLLDVEGKVVGRSLMEAFRLHELQEITRRSHEEGRVPEFEIKLGGSSSKIFVVNAVVLRLERVSVQDRCWCFMISPK